MKVSLAAAVFAILANFVPTFGPATRPVIPAVSNIPVPCARTYLFAIGARRVYRSDTGNVIFYHADLEVDADGAPRAYHPTNDKLALDYKQNGYPFAMVRMNGRFAIQGENDPAPGFYVSMTSLEDVTKGRTDPARYVDAETIPYVVLPPRVVREGKVKLGDFAAVVNRATGHVVYAIFADIGPKKKLGEGSIALGKELGLNKSPKKGGAAADLAYVIFPGSGDGKPKPATDIAARGAELFSAWGGLDKVRACLP